jgi:hypothetical protein
MEWRKENAKRHEFECLSCGKVFHSHGLKKLTCSQRCTYDLGLIAPHLTGVEDPRIRATIDRAAALVKTRRLDSRSPIRAAYEDGDMPRLLTEIRANCLIGPTGCWEWQGTRVAKSNGQYAYVNYGRKRLAVHRLAAMTKYGDIGSEPVVHHACHLTYCVNPDHLSPVSARENNIEMLEREFYLTRITELESALRQAVPTHPLLPHPDRRE